VVNPRVLRITAVPDYYSIGGTVDIHIRGAPAILIHLMEGGRRVAKVLLYIPEAQGVE